MLLSSPCCSLSLPLECCSWLLHPPSCRRCGLPACVREPSPVRFGTVRERRVGGGATHSHPHVSRRASTYQTGEDDRPTRAPCVGPASRRKPLGASLGRNA